MAMNARADGLPQRRPRRYAYGVYWRKRKRPWIVKFNINKRTVYIGSYLNYDDAVFAAKTYAENKLP